MLNTVRCIKSRNWDSFLSHVMRNQFQAVITIRALGAALEPHLDLRESVETKGQK